MRFSALTIAGCLLMLTGCIETKHQVETRHKVDPIHITVDVNLKVDRELNDFFGDLDQESDLINYDESGTAAQ